jgi:hypothetical protein
VNFIVAWLLVVGLLGGFVGLMTLLIKWEDIGLWVYDKLVERGTLVGNADPWEVESVWNWFGVIIVAFLFSLLFAAALVDGTNQTSSVDNAPDKVIEYSVE